MSHTSQRRGLSPDRPGEEIVVLAMIQAAYRNKEGIGSAMSELAEKMLDHNPHLWLSHNFAKLDVPQVGSKAPFIRALGSIAPESTRRLVMRAVAQRSSVITAIYTDEENVVSLLKDVGGDWLERNKREGYPISITLSGLFDDVHKCCGRLGLREHTYLHSIGFHGKTEKLPGATELELLTMCGHGLISQRLIEDLTMKIKSGQLTPQEAAENMSMPCVCGIVNRDRAERVFRRLAQG